jgi:hypothetical protein
MSQGALEFFFSTEVAFVAMRYGLQNETTDHRVNADTGEEILVGSGTCSESQ